MTDETRETFGHMIDVTLSSEDLDAKKNRLVVVDNEIAEIMAKKAAAVAGFNSDLKDRRKEQTTLLGTITTGAAKIELQCYNERDDRRGIMLTRRNDNGEIVDERALTAEEREASADERQGKLFEPAPGADAPAPDAEEEEGGDADTEAALDEYMAGRDAAGTVGEEDANHVDASDEDDEDDAQPVVN